MTATPEQQQGQPGQALSALPWRDRVQPSWRQHALTRADEIHALADRFKAGGADPEFVRALEAQLAEARREARGWRRVAARISGSSVEQTLARLSAAEADLLRIADDRYLVGELASILKHVERHLPVDDPRRQRVQDIVHAQGQTLTTEDRECLIAAARGASTEAGREIRRVRSFRNVLVVASLMLTSAAVVLAVFAAERPDRFPLCFAVEEAGTAPGTTSTQPKIVCPSEETDIRKGDQDAAVGAAVAAKAMLRASSSWVSSQPRSRPPLRCEVFVAPRHPSRCPWRSLCSSSRPVP